MGRDSRVAINEGLLRDMNDRIDELMDRFGDGEAGAQEQEADFLCECGNEDCIDTVRMSVREYENARRVENQFVVFPGHEDPDVEDVAATRARYTVVRKHPAEASIAEETDPHRH
jgi:hypothetical protein